MPLLKLTQEQVNKMRKTMLKPGWTYAGLAEKYGCSPLNIYNVSYNKIWANPKFDPDKVSRPEGQTGRPSFFNEAQHAEVIELHRRGWSQTDIAKVFETTRAIVRYAVEGYDRYPESEIENQKPPVKVMKSLLTKSSWHCPEIYMDDTFVLSLASAFDMPPSLVYSTLKPRGK